MVHAPVSNDWKNRLEKFQRLEKTAQNFPTIGKRPLKSFQRLENPEKTGKGVG
jgi:hypothetical protein